MVLPDVPVCQQLHFLHVLRCQHGVKVDCHQLMADMEPHIVAVEASAQNAADNVFPAVLLHKVEPPLKIYRTRGLTPNLQRPVAGVVNDAVPLPHIGHRRAAQRAMVGRLAAALRIESRSVQLDLPAVFGFLTAERPSGEFCQK